MLELIADLIRPEALEADQRLVEGAEILLRHPADNRDRAELTLIELLHHFARALAGLGQRHAHASAVGLAALVVDESRFDELLQVVGNVGSQVVAAALELPRRQLAVTDVVEKQRLHAVEIELAEAIELVLDDIEKETMEPFDESQALQILRPERVVLKRRARTRDVESDTHCPASCLFDASRYSGLRRTIGQTDKSCLNTESKR